MAVDHGVLYGKIAEYTEALVNNPLSPVFVGLCEAYRQLGMLAEAADVAVQGLKHNPVSLPGLVSLGRVLAQQGHHAGAVDAFDRAVALDGTSLPALTGLARVLQMQGDTLRAREVVRQAVGIAPDDPAVKKLQAALGGAEKASAQTAPVPPAPVQSAPVPPTPTEIQPPPGAANLDPIATQTIAELYERQGLTERALKVYRDLLHKDPENASLQQKIAQLQNQQELAPNPTEVLPPAIGDAHSVAAVPDHAADTRYLDILNRWLTVILQRRAHV